MNALEDLKSMFSEQEKIQLIVFGGWRRDGDNEDIKFVPDNLKNVLLTEEEAAPYMKGWSFYGGYGAPECYAVTVWTNFNVYWVPQHDGSTWLNKVPRNPTCIRLIGTKV